MPLPSSEGKWGSRLRAMAIRRSTQSAPRDTDFGLRGRTAQPYSISIPNSRSAIITGGKLLSAPLTYGGIEGLAVAGEHAGDGLVGGVQHAGGRLANRVQSVSVGVAARLRRR